MSGKRAALIAATATALSVAAFAGHGKAGLWSTTTVMTMGGQPHSITSTYCMTADEVKMDYPKPPPGNSGCEMQNMHVNGNTVSADMVCKGQSNARGHFETTYSGPEHYTSKFSMSVQGMDMVSTVDAHWVKPDCAGAQH